MAGTQRRQTNQRSTIRRKKRKKESNAPKLVLLLFLIIIIALIIFGLKSCGGALFNKTKETEAKIETDITVDGINIKGLTIAEAKKALIGEYNWDMMAVLDTDATKTISIDNLLDKAVDNTLNNIYANLEAASETDTEEKQTSYSIDYSSVDSDIESEADRVEKEWTVEPKNGSISGFDKASGEFTYSGEETGTKVDKDSLISDIKNALSSKDYKAKITVHTSIVQPEITKEQAMSKYKTIGTYTTKTTSNNDRNNNINLACEAIDGLVLMPGEEFSFNQTTGNRTKEKGYKEAGAYVNGVVTTEPGGGVCQVSSTLYNAVIFSGLQTTERHAHTFEPSYVTPGEDAMVSYDGYSGPDMKFINTTSAALVIRAHYADQKLTMSIIGIPILEDGVTISMHSEKAAEYDEPAPEYEEDQTLMPGVEVLAKAGTKGSRWVTNIIKKKDGQVISDEFFHNSTYKGHAPVVKRNTSGIVVDANGESVSIDPSASSETIESASGSTDATQATTKASTATQGGPGVTTQAQIAETTKAGNTAATTSGEAASTEPQTTAQETVETVPPAPGH